jgi:hypothetical protein
LSLLNFVSNSACSSNSDVRILSANLGSPGDSKLKYELKI